MERLAVKLRALESIGELLRGRRLASGEAAQYGRFAPEQVGKSLEQLLREPAIGMEDLVALEPRLAAFGARLRAQVELDVKYAGYVRRQEAQVERFRRREGTPIPPGFRYDSVSGLSAETREKLELVRPLSLGQASRISGVRAADLSLLLLHLSRRPPEPEEAMR